MSTAPIVVVGAGLSGLAAARRARDLGRPVVVFEKSRGLGGRLATRRVDGVPVDHGCPVLDIPDGTALVDVAADLGPDATIPVGGTTARALPAGMTALAKALADGIDVRRDVRVGSLRRQGSCVAVADDTGAPLVEAGAAILSAPGPQTAQLLRSAGERERAEAVEAVPYEQAVMLLAGFPSAARSGVIGPDGLFTRIVREDEKGRDTNGGEAVVGAQLTPAASVERFAAHDEAVAAEVLPALAGVVGAGERARWWQVKRWRYATPLGRLTDDSAWDTGTGIFLCGDVMTGVDLDAVYRSGLRAGEAASS